jgi:hypothetical protein
VVFEGGWLIEPLLDGVLSFPRMRFLLFLLDKLLLLALFVMSGWPGLVLAVEVDGCKCLLEIS